MIDNTVFQDKTVSFHTLGCKLNFSETSHVGKQFVASGFRKVKFGERADVCVVNTCSVTDIADKKCRQAINKILKQHPDTFMVVTGCYAQLKPEEVGAIPGVDLVLGANEKFNILDFMPEIVKHDTAEIHHSDINKRTEFKPSYSRTDRTRCFLKVQDGCDYFCTYCTIPFARGRSRNATVEATVEQAKKAIAEGAREIILSGVNIGDFGKSSGETFYDLLLGLDKISNLERLRISSIEPNLLNEDIIDLVRRSDKFMPHFHTPIQSGSDSMLLLMKRKYDTELFKKRMNQIKEAIPDAFIGVDVIVGMNGETEEMFQETHQFLQDMPISQLHVFTYSERSGTKALDIEGKVAPADKKLRSQKLQLLSDKKLRQFYQENGHESRPILWEQQCKGDKMFGFTDNYVRVSTSYKEEWVNQIVFGRIGEYMPETNTMNVLND